MSTGAAKRWGRRSTRRRTPPTSFSGSRLAQKAHDGVGRPPGEHRKQPGDDDYEVALIAQTQHFAQALDPFFWVDPRWRRQHQHAWRAPEVNRRIVDDTEAVDVDLDRPPLLVAHIEIDFAVERRRAQIDFPPVPVEQRLRLKGLDRRRHRLRGRRAVLFGVVDRGATD